MIRQSAAEIRGRAERLLASLLAALPSLKAELTPGESAIGGGATPEQSIPTWLIAIECADEAAAQRRLRANDPPVIARVEKQRLVLDLRTVLPEEETELAAALQALS
jgi:L-seryl-tRNA(Ser) seleniumtransferase